MSIFDKMKSNDFPCDEKDFGDELRESMAEYSLYTAYDRSVPCIVDGLKPVQRRLVYASWMMPQRANGKTSKCAKLVGDTMGNYHPHGDAGIYEALVKLVSPTISRYNLFFNGQGNFGDAAMGDSAAASRYTETKISEYGELFADKIDSLAYCPNYDGTLQEPIFMCPPFPAFLMNESIGIGSGIAGSAPGHNLVDICEATELLLSNPNCSDDDLISKIKGPDFALGGNIMDLDSNRQALKNIYCRGSGTLYLEAKWHLAKSDLIDWKYLLTVDEFCPGMTIEAFTGANSYLNSLLSKGLIHIRDDSAGSDNVQIHIYSNSNNVLVEHVIPQLRWFTRHYRTTAVDLIPVVSSDSGEVTYKERLITTGLRYTIGRWYKFRCETLKTHFNASIYRLEQDLWKAELRKRLIEDPELINRVRNCDSQEELDHVLYEEMGLTPEQAAYVMRIQLGTLIRLNSDALQQEIDKLHSEIDKCNYNLDNLLEYVLIDLRQIRKKYGDPRRTSVFLQQEIPEREELSYLVTFKDAEFKLNVNDQWPANGVGLSRTANAFLAGDNVILATYDGGMVPQTIGNITSSTWYAAGLASPKDNLMVVVDENSGVDFRYIPENQTKRLMLTKQGVTLKHATGIDLSSDCGVLIRLNGNAWSFMSKQNLEAYATDKPRKFWSYYQSKDVHATQVFRVGCLDDLVGADGAPLEFNREDCDTFFDGQAYVVSDFNLVTLKSGRISYMDKATVFARWDSISDVIPLHQKGGKPLSR